jgi:hypothetical protein
MPPQIIPASLAEPVQTRESPQRRRDVWIAAGLVVGFLLLYHANGGFLVGRDPTASVYLPLSLLDEGNLAFTPDEMPQMFAWEYQAAGASAARLRVRFESWGQKAATLLVWPGRTSDESKATAASPSATKPPATPCPLATFDNTLAPELTAGQLRAAGRLAPLEPDYYLVPSIDPQRRGYVNTFGPGAGLTALPLVAVERLLVGDLTHNKAVLWYGAKLVASFCVAVSVAMVFLAARELLGESPALAIAVIYGAGTCVWSVASQTLWQSGPNVMFLALAGWCLVRVTRDGASDLWAAGCGLAVACAVVCRPTSALVVIAIGLYLAAVAWRHWQNPHPLPLSRKRARGDGDEREPQGFRFRALRPLVLYVLAGLPIAIWLGYHNWHYLGSPLTFGDMIASRQLAQLKAGTSDVWSGSWFEGFYGLLASPSRGLLVFSPVLGFALWGAIQAWRDPRFGVLRPLSLGTTLVLALSAKWYDWAGGWSFGYRLLIDTLPLLALTSVAVADTVRRHRPLQVLLMATVLWSVGVQVLGAFAYDVTGWNNRRAYVVQTPGQTQPRLFYQADAARRYAQARRAQVRTVSLDIDRKVNHRRLWSIGDSQLVYYLTHFAESRENKRRMVDDFLRAP